MKKEHHYIEIFMGADYNIEQHKTIGDFQSFLEKIIEDLPSDKSLEMAETHAWQNKLGYTLKEGIPQ